MIELYDGRPVNTSGRAKKETAVYDLLDSLGIKYKRADHEAAIRWRRAQKSTDCLRLRSYVKTCFSAIRRKQDFTCL